MASSAAFSSPIEALYVIGLILMISGCAYASYWSLSIRRTMRVPYYRRQTLVVGLISVYAILLVTSFYTVDFFAPGLQTTSVGTLQAVMYGLLPIVLFAWADSSIRVGRRTDPLLRDSFRWSSLRWVLWPIMLFCFVAFNLNGIFCSASGVCSVGGALLNDVGTPAFLLEFVIVGVTVLGVFTTARRAGDYGYRRSLEWFGISLVVILGQNAGFVPLTTVASNVFAYSTVNVAWGLIANLILLPFIAYCFYKCSRTLVPLNRLSLSD
jgi:uncharacterized membrane protein